MGPKNLTIHYILNNNSIEETKGFEYSKFETTPIKNKEVSSDKKGSQMSIKEESFFKTRMLDIIIISLLFSVLVLSIIFSYIFTNQQGNKVNRGLSSESRIDLAYEEIRGEDVI